MELPVVLERVPHAVPLQVVPVKLQVRAKPVGRVEVIAAVWPESRASVFTERLSVAPG